MIGTGPQHTIVEVPPLKKAVVVSLAALVGVLLVAGIASAERFVMVTHTQGTDPFWPVVQKGGEDAARAVGADFEYNFAPSGDMADMARLIEAAVATQPDGIVVSLPDADALGGAIKSAVEAGIPVITMNSGLESSAAVGALMHVGQPERLAGEKAGERAKAEAPPRRSVSTRSRSTRRWSTAVPGTSRRWGWIST